MKESNIAETSMDTFLEPENTKNRESHAKSIVMYLQVNRDRSYTVFEIAKGVGHLDDMQVTRRMKELITSGKAVHIKNVKIKSSWYSKYQFNKSGIKPELEISRFEKLQNNMKQILSEEQFNEVMELYNRKND